MFLSHRRVIKPLSFRYNNFLFCLAVVAALNSTASPAIISVLIAEMHNSISLPPAPGNRPTKTIVWDNDDQWGVEACALGVRGFRFGIRSSGFGVGCF